MLLLDKWVGYLYFLVCDALKRLAELSIFNGSAPVLNKTILIFVSLDRKPIEIFREPYRFFVVCFEGGLIFYAGNNFPAVSISLLCTC